MDLLVRHLGRCDYVDTLRAMQDFTAARTPATDDELWLLEHAPVYTMGLRGAGRVHAPIGGIPVVQTDRGGDMTYHGPGQVVVYLLLDIARRGLGIKALVRLIEQSVINVLATHGVAGTRRPGAPGVYVADAKIAALGLRVRSGATYHGLAVNVDADLTPFRAIDPCGYPGLVVTRLSDLATGVDTDTTGAALAHELQHLLGYNRARAPHPVHSMATPTGTHG